jgi:hypothetical protein
LLRIKRFGPPLVARQAPRSAQHSIITSAYRGAQRPRKKNPLIVRDETCRRAISITSRNPPQKPIPKSLINSDAASRAAGDTMRNHDFVSDGFLALIVAGLLLLCSILVVIALH